MSFTTQYGRVLVGALCIAFVLYAAVVPVGRACLRMQVSYNEGWNVYNASTVAHHGLLYPARYGWTTVNYPALSFYVVAELQRFTHDFLFTARALAVLSTALCSLLVGRIVWSLKQRHWSALLAGLFCFGLFCVSADKYVGQDDPQMLAQVFFLAGLLVYVCYRQKLGTLALVALLFVVGGNIKPNLVEFPLAVLLDLLFVSRRRALQFCLIGGALAALSIALNTHFGGPDFLPVLLTPRSYSLQHLFEVNMHDVYQPIVAPGLIALALAVHYRKNAERRILSLFFAASLLSAMVFGGGQGVTINSQFGQMLCQTILLGLFLDDLRSAEECPAWLATAAPLFLFGWLVIPLSISGNWRPIRELAEARAAQQRFQQETAVLAAQPGPALCESLLRCYYAQKPYVYDPFNATRLIRLGKLDPNVIAAKLERQEFGAVQLDRPLEIEYDKGPGKERFVPAILRAVERHYMPAFENEDGVIYVPDRGSAQVSVLRSFRGRAKTPVE